MNLEEEFAVTFPLEEIFALDDVGELHNLIEASMVNKSLKAAE